MMIKRVLLKLLTKRHYRQFIKDTNQPQEVHSWLWNQEILPLLKKSTYWSTQMNQNVTLPLSSFDITHYEDYQPYLEQTLSSSVQPFNGEDILFWSETSATTGARKYFPITKSFQKQFQRTMAPYFYSLLQRFPNFLREKIIYLAAWETGVVSPSHIPMGLISHYNYKNLPGLIQSFYALPVEVFKDKETFHQWAPVYALAYDLSAVFAIVPIGIDLFLKNCIEHFKSYLPYILGEKALPPVLPPIKINKRRRAYLKKLSSDHTLTYKKLWPGLTLTGCWIEGPCKTYAHQLKQDLGNTIELLDGTYSATEGWLTIPIDQNHQGSVYHPRTHIVEFIEEDKPIEKKSLLSCWQLEPGKKYEVFLTTAMGFVRYRLKDVVQCTGYFNQAPILSFCYKAASLLLDYCSLTESDLRKAVAHTNISLKPYWHFACDARRNRIFFVVDDDSLGQSDVDTIHQELVLHNEKYAYECEQGNVLPAKLKKVNREILIRNHHAQTKPKIISQEFVSME
jgi:hypothetical protein